MRLDAHGLALELPHGWSGRIFSRQPGAATLHAGNFPIALEDGEFGDRSTAGMRPGAAFVALVEYVPGGDLRPGTGLFSSSGLPRRLDPVAFRPTTLAHPRPDQAGFQHFFTLHERPFSLYVVLAGERFRRRAQLAAVDHVLGRLKIDRR